jgi:protein-arginine kinase
MLTQETEFTPGVSESAILSRVRAFAEQNSREAAFEKAALDAKYVTAMINFVEQEFGVIVSSCEISEDNLGSIGAVARFVANKQPFAVG